MTSKQAAAVLVASLLAWACSSPEPTPALTDPDAQQAAPTAPYLIVLGTTQDAGSPQAGCTKACCADLWTAPDATRRVSSLGLVDPATQQCYLFDATPDLPRQLRHLSQAAGATTDLPTGIFLTHAHMGHYTGLMHLGREAMGAREVPVYAMPRMGEFLRTNGPWSQLLALSNIELRTLQADSTIQLASVANKPALSLASPEPVEGNGTKLAVTPLLVPHRDEFSETVGYRIDGPNKSALFIPDIDKWERWELSLEEQLAQVDYALLDATFYDGDELPGRDMAAIPHPFVVETMALLDGLPARERSKVYFIHLNHTNPLLDAQSPASEVVRAAGYQVARFDLRLGL